MRINDHVFYRLSNRQGARIRKGRVVDLMKDFVKVFKKKKAAWMSIKSIVPCQKK